MFEVLFEALCCFKHVENFRRGNNHKAAASKHTEETVVFTDLGTIVSLFSLSGAMGQTCVQRLICKYDLFRRFSFYMKQQLKKKQLISKSTEV